ncbi:MAG: hypothetical protein ACE5I3_14735, partial [Phycisphaerae bacterium]
MFNTVGFDSDCASEFLARYQYPNPLDLMFFAADAAARRMGLPGIYIHAVFDLRGRLDVGAFERALAALYRLYPTVGARRELSALTGRPRWRLDATPVDPARVVQVHAVVPATQERLRRQIEDLVATQVDSLSPQPVRFHVFRGLAGGDVLVMRWPHALMDARGGTLVLEEIDRLYREAPDPKTLRSAGDERRNDYEQLLARTPRVRRAKMILDWMTTSRAREAEAVQLGQSPASARVGRPRYILRHLTPEQTRQIRDNALRVCGFGRFGDFLRACAIRALHAIRPEPVAPEALYTTLNLINNRKRRQRGPVCWNLTSALPIAVPAGLADDRRLVAELIREQMVGHLASETALRGLASLSMLMRVPTAVAAAAIHAAWTSERSG